MRVCKGDARGRVFCARRREREAREKKEKKADDLHKLIRAGSR